MKKAVRLLAVLMLIASLAGCRAKKTLIDESSTIVQVDTTKTVADNLTVTQTVSGTETASLTATHTTTHTTATAAQVEGSTVVDFVDSGGTVSIDTAGNITLTGVKSIKDDRRRQHNEVKGSTQTDTETLTEAKETSRNGTITNTHNEQVNGITTNEQKQSRQEKETAITRPKWYQTILAKIGCLCCIAALLLLLFLYLKRKF